MMGVCFLVWCLGQGVPPAEGVTFTHDIRDSNRTERILVYESGAIVGGIVMQAATADAMFAGLLPAQINIGRGRLLVEGGGMIASHDVPAAGTRANFIARANLRVTDRLAIVYWHFSNGELGDRNPAVDSVGITVKLRQGPRIRGLRP